MKTKECFTCNLPFLKICLHHTSYLVSLQTMNIFFGFVIFQFITEHGMIDAFYFNKVKDIVLVGNNIDLSPLTLVIPS